MQPIGNHEIAAVIEKIPFNELIFAGRLYRENMKDIMTEKSFCKTLERLCNTGKLCRVSKGIYYRPKVGRYGVVPLSDREIIETFTGNNTGTIIGYSLYNQLCLTTQVPKRIEVLSSRINQQSRTIRNIHITKSEIEYTEKNKAVIHMLEVLKNFNAIEDLNYPLFIHYCKTFAEQYCDKTTQYVLNVMHHRKCTISFLREILSYYNVHNTLGNHLSSLSEYKHPSMEAIYEAARIS